MKTIGLLGGMSWESTVSYYQAINIGVKQRLGGLHSAKIILLSVDFAEIEAMQQCGDWDGMAEILAVAAQQLQAAGAEGVVICTNTMHKVADSVQNAVDIPLLHIADATAQALIDDGVESVGLLGTAFTMEQAFYIERLQARGLHVVVPDAAGRKVVHDIIYQELCLGTVNEASRQQYLDIIDQLSFKVRSKVSKQIDSDDKAGVQGVILGCTEIGLLVKPEDTSVPLYDTTAIHAAKAVDFILA